MDKNNSSSQADSTLLLSANSSSPLEGILTEGLGTQLVIILPGEAKAVINGINGIFEADDTVEQYKYKNA